MTMAGRIQVARSVLPAVTEDGSLPAIDDDGRRAVETVLKRIEAAVDVLRAADPLDESAAVEPLDVIPSDGVPAPDPP